MWLAPYKIVFRFPLIFFLVVYFIDKDKSLVSVECILIGFIRWWSLMKGNEAAGNVLMDTTDDGESLNLILCPQIQEGFFPITRVWLDC